MPGPSDRWPGLFRLYLTPDFVLEASVTCRGESAGLGGACSSFIANSSGWLGGWLGTKGGSWQVSRACPHLKPCGCNQVQVCSMGEATQRQDGRHRTQGATGYCCWEDSKRGPQYFCDFKVQSDQSKSCLQGGLYLDKGNRLVSLFPRCWCNLCHLIFVYHIHVGRWACCSHLTDEESGDQGI